MDIATGGKDENVFEIQQGVSLNFGVNVGARLASPNTKRQKGEASLAPTVTRPISDYSRDELIAVLQKFVQRKWMTREDAPHESARVLGFARAGRQIQSAFKSAITGAIRRGILEYESDSIRRTK